MSERDDPAWLVPNDGAERYLDYCHQPYAPLRPTAAKLRSESLLWQSLGGDPLGARAVFERVRGACGRDMTVFGVKQVGDRRSWELYFYDPRKGDPTARASAVAAAVAPALRLRALPNERVPYFMFSVEVGPGELARGAVDELTLYLAEPVAQAGRSYKLRADGRAELDNLYHFLRPREDVREVLARVRGSAFVDVDAVGLQRVIPPELFACNRVCVAKKRDRDGVYFSGIDVGQFEWFLARYGHPADVRGFVARHRDRLDHLRFDVGIDYAPDGAGGLAVLKTSYYGTL